MQVKVLVHSHLKPNSRLQVLSVKQLIFYQTVLQNHKVLLGSDPVYFKQRVSTLHLFQTRQAAGASGMERITLGRASC